MYADGNSPVGRAGKKDDYTITKGKSGQEILVDEKGWYLVYKGKISR